MLENNFWKQFLELRPMKRKAILIAGDDVENPINPYSPSQGVKNDISAWKNFLMSDLGGSWRNDEIMELSSTTSDAVKAAIYLAKNSDYSLIAFSGHGYLKKNKWGLNETMMVLGRNQEIAERELNTGSPWCMAIMDCCRNYPTRETSEMNFAKEAQTESLRVNTRQLYENEIRKCETGFVTVYSADVGQSAADVMSFTRFLIETADERIDFCPNGVLNIRDAVYHTAPKMQPIQAEDGQIKQWNPVYNGGRRRSHFPFAVKFTSLDD